MDRRNLLQRHVWLKHNYIQMFNSNGWITHSLLLESCSSKPYWRGIYLIEFDSDQALRLARPYFSAELSDYGKPIPPRALASPLRRLVVCRDHP